MDSLKVIGQTKDYRTKTDVLYAQIKIEDYLSLVGKDFDRFEIQRKREKHKGYNRLKSDIENGALIPTITLAVEPSVVSEYSQLLKDGNFEDIVTKLYKDPGKIYILDGLQRTYIINDIKENEHIFNTEQKLLLEIWFEPVINHLIYRLIVLNSGQKPMSMRHQIELLFITMRQTLVRDIDGLAVLEEKDEERRKKAKEFPFERLVTAYKSFLTKSPEIDKDNIVAERMIENDILESEEKFLSESFIKYKEYLSVYTQLDQEVFRIYVSTPLNKYRNWLADGNVIISVFAAIAKYGVDAKRETIVKTALESLLSKVKVAANGEDPLELEKFTEIRAAKADPKKYNVGFATRKILTNGFIEFFRSEGDDSLGDCWLMSSAEL
ncbi:hypothetical protein ACFQZS_14785 [Mucilaginibacter calamicampi]|uniref:DUF262 domain-containing protein n=1 Tax=Mucilaginibacter calamicampi TaxID=1302352 RepID=A0ABW2YYV6_9SPHI